MDKGGRVADSVTLVPIEHEHRLASPDEASALYRALGEKRVSARGFRTRDPEQIRRVIDAIDSKRDHTITFEQGSLDGSAWTALGALCASRFGYLDVRTLSTSLRIWPKRESWVHHGDPLEKVTTKDGPSAFSVFRQHADSTVSRGFINGVHPTTAAGLTEFVLTAHLEIHAVLVLALAEAQQLTELFGGESLDWQGGGVTVEFPEGRIHDFLKTPKVDEADRQRWRRRIGKALQRAGLRD